MTEDGLRCSSPAGTQDRESASPSVSTHRELRVLDQMLSMHATLRDRTYRTATVVRVVLLCLSALSVAFAFAGPDHPVTLVGLTAARSAWLGGLSVLVFAGTLTDLVTDRRTTAHQHAVAVTKLGELKLDYRKVSQEREWAAAASRLTERYNAVMDGLPPIPERRFNQLKAAHLRKIAISRTLSDHPGMTHQQARRHVTRKIRESAQQGKNTPGNAKTPSGPTT